MRTSVMIVPFGWLILRRFPYRRRDYRFVEAHPSALDADTEFRSNDAGLLQPCQRGRQAVLGSVRCECAKSFVPRVSRSELPQRAQQDALTSCRTWSHRWSTTAEPHGEVHTPHPRNHEL